MKFYGIEKLSMVDFEGVLACTLFTGGCNFACPFCHNSSLALCRNLPETLDETEVFGYLKSRQGILDAVVVSGGEPTLYADLPDFLTRLKSLGYLVKLDTNGTNPKMLKGLIESKLIDYVAMDIKSSPDGYSLATGIEGLDIRPIKQSVELLKQGNVDYEFRTTLVYELHSRADIEQIAEWLKGAKRLRLQKFVDSGDCIAEGLTPVSEKEAKEYVKLLSEGIKDVRTRGY